MTKLNINDNYDPRVKICPQKKRGFYYLDYLLPPQNGKPGLRRRLKAFKSLRHTQLLRTKKEAQLLEHEFSDDDLRCMGFDPDDRSDEPTLVEFLPTFRKFREFGRARPLSPRTIDEQEKIIMRFFLRPVGTRTTLLGDVRLNEFNRTLIQDFIAELQQTHSDKTRTNPEGRLSAKYINNVTGVLGRILTIAEYRGVIERRPKVDHLPVVHEANEEDILVLEECRRLWDACKGSHGRMIRLLLLTGLRAMEAAGLRWEDFDEKAEGGPVLRIRQQYLRYGRREGEPQFRQPKCDSRRVLPVGPALMMVLQEQKAETRLQDGLIFLSERGRPVCNELIRNALERTCRRAGIRRVGPQVLRRTFVSQTQMASGDLEAASLMAGHKDTRVTRESYSRTEGTHFRHVMAQLEDRLIGGQDDPRPDLKEAK